MTKTNTFSSQIFNLEDLQLTTLYDHDLTLDDSDSEGAVMHDMTLKLLGFGGLDVAIMSRKQIK